MPGAGAYSSLVLACRIGSIERFPRPQSLANYWGLTPRCRNSGEATDRLGSITKEGSAMARFLLGQMVLHVLRRDGTMRAVVSRNQEAARIEDRASGCDATVGDDSVAYGETQRGVCRWRTSKKSAWRRRADDAEPRFGLRQKGPPRSASAITSARARARAEVTATAEGARGKCV